MEMNTKYNEEVNKNRKVSTTHTIIGGGAVRPRIRVKTT